MNSGPGDLSHEAPADLPEGDPMETFELNSVFEHDQLAAELTRRAKVIAQFFRTMVDDGLPEGVATTIVVEWARASLQAGIPPCGCDCDICRGEGTG